jgi:hypothetical protein
MDAEKFRHEMTKLAKQNRGEKIANQNQCSTGNRIDRQHAGRMRRRLAGFIGQWSKTIDAQRQGGDCMLCGLECDGGI